MDDNLPLEKRSIKGTCMELFENSDNTVSGNLTKKFILGLIVPVIVVSIFQVPIMNSAANSSTEKIFSVGMADDVNTLNPFAAVEDDEYIVMEFIYDYIFYPELYGGTWPSLVSSGWYMNGETAAALGTDFSSIFDALDPLEWPLGSIWEYNLTEGVFWNDGMPFTAEDVAWTINIQVGPNYMTFWAFQPSTRWIHHAEAINDHKVRVFFCKYETREPFPIAFGYSLSMPIMPKHVFEDEPLTYVAFNWDGFPAVGTGPFMGTEKLRDELLAGETLTLIRNPYYNFIDANDERTGLGAAYNADPEIDKVIIKLYSEQMTFSLGVRNGDVDTAEIPVDTYINWIQDSTFPEDIKLVKMLSSWQYSRQVVFNAYPQATGIVNPLRLDPAVHRASVLATNKSLFIDIIYKGFGVEGVGLISPYSEDWWWEPGDELSYFNVTDGNGDPIPGATYAKPIDEVMEYDPDLANNILDWAGYYWDGEMRRAGPLVGERMQNLFGSNPSLIVDQPLEFDMVVYSGPSNDQQIFDFLAQQWKEVGIKLNEQFVSSASWSEFVYSYNFEVTITYWSGDVDPNYLCFIPTSYALFGWNEFGTDDDYYDSIYIEQVKPRNYTERKNWSDECLKWQYLSGSINTLVYPEKCFAYSEKKWTNWYEDEEPFYSYMYAEYIYQEEDTSGILYLVAGIMLFIVAPVAIFILVKFLRKRKELKFLSDEDSLVEK